MTSFIAAGGSGRCTSVMPAVPAASSVTTIAFIRDLPQADPVIPLPTADRDHPARLVIAIGDFHTAESFAAPSHARVIQRPLPRRERGVPGAQSRTKPDDGYGP